MRELILALLFIFVGCSATKFAGGARQEPQPATPPNPPPLAGEVTESFALEKVRGKIDLVWIIDNSGSMREEAAQVRANFTRFLTSIQSTSDIKLALISAPSNGLSQSTSVDLSSEALAAGHIQIPAAVGSTNALAIAASATCAATSTDLSTVGNQIITTATTETFKICDQTVRVELAPFLPFPPHLEAAIIVSEMRGKLTSFFRQEAVPIYVVVTDDNANVIDQANFVKLVTPALHGARPFVFAFRGIASQTQCSVARRGTAYEALAQETGGEVFDICEPDWSPNFQKLEKQVARIANSSFRLKTDKIASIKEVRLDSKPLPAGSYTLSGNLLTIKVAALNQDGTTISVVYLPAS